MSESGITLSSDSKTDLSPESVLRAAREEMEAERLYHLAEQWRENYLNWSIISTDFEGFPKGKVKNYVVEDKGVEAEELRLALACPLREMLWFEHGILPPAIPDQRNLQNIFATMEPGMKIENTWRPYTMIKGPDSRNHKVLFLGATAGPDSLSLVSVVKGLTENNKPFYRTYLKKGDKKAE